MGEDDEDPDEPANGGFCPKCDGSGRNKWDDGITDCEHCHGEGYEWWQ